MPNTTPAAKTAADQYITIPVAEYVYLHKQATMLEMIVRDPAFTASETVRAAVAVYEHMNDLGEAGADQ